MNQPSEPTKAQICSICGDDYLDDGHNAWPINPGRCCDHCNNIVVMHRLRNSVRGLNPYGDPAWYRDIIDAVTAFWREHKAREERADDAKQAAELTAKFPGWDSV